MLQYTTRPISDRSPFTGKHTRSAFDTSWRKVLLLLEREVGMLRGRNVVIELDVREDQIRLDGGVYANASPATPAVRIAFESKHGPITMATDRFSAWRDNVYAIALSLESLRRVGRYGVTKHGEQYQGWKAIGSGAVALGAALTFDEATSILRGFADDASLNSWADVIRAAKANTHPDRNDGNRIAWDQVEQAARVVEAAA